MNDFLIEHRSLIYHSSEFIAAVIGLLLYKSYKKTSTIYFIHFLFAAWAVDAIGGYTNYVIDYEFLHSLRDLLKDTILEKNRWWYTIFWQIGATLLILRYYMKILKSKGLLSILKVVGWLFLVVSIGKIVINFDAFFVKSFPIHQILSTSVVLVCITFYFIDLLGSDTILTFNKSVSFYVSCIFLLWYLTIATTQFYEPYYNSVDNAYVRLRRLIYIYAIVGMYGSFGITLIYCRPKKIENLAN